MPPTQKKIRDLERIIKKKGSTPDLEKKLKALQNEKDGKQLKEKEKKNSEKYHMVKFVERQKVVRKIRTTRAQMSTTEDTECIKEIKLKESKLLDDLCYIMYYPKDMKYIGLFSKTEETNNNPKSLAKTKSLQQSALKLAQDSRTYELEQGIDDRVIQAIESVNSTLKHNKISTSNVSQSDSKSLSKKRNVSSLGESIEYSLKPKLQRKENSIINSSNKSTHDVEKVKLDKLNGNKSSSLQPTDDTRDNQGSRTTEAEIDPFFVDETSGALGTTTEKDLKPPQYKMSIGDIRKHASSKYDHNRKVVIENDGTMNKQELRLLNWQMKVRGRKV